MFNKRRVTINAIDKNSSMVTSTTVVLNDHLDESLEDFVDSIPYLKYYMEADCIGFELSDEEYELFDKYEIDV